MSTTWAQVVNNSDERKVFESLADPQWDYRTIDGIQRSSGLSTARIREILDKYAGQYVLKSSIPDSEGHELYTLQSNRAEVQEILRRIRTFVGKSIA